MPSRPSPTWYIALAVVRHADRFCLVHEKKDRGWYLPAGRVDPGETLVQGGKREVLEEAGLEVEFDGILRIEHTPEYAGRDARLRIFLLGHPVGGQLKSEPDSESLGAEWVTLDECANYRLRSPEVLKHFRYVAEGGSVFPMSMLTLEGAPYR
jgi:phosphatase NudJ